MNIHEHQAKELFDGYDIPVSKGSVAYEKSQINEAVGKVKGPIWVVNCLLYTSPSPRDRSLSRMPSSA